MMKLVAGIALSLAFASCVWPPGFASAATALVDSPVGEFVGPPGSIRIDLSQRTIAIADETHPLVDCSNAEFHCFKSEEVGFHVVFPQSCARRANIRGEALGGATFYQFAMVEHGDARQGRYASELSDRFAYSYFDDRGLFEFQYDPGGQARFGPSQWAGPGHVAWPPFTYRLPEGHAFLRCRG